MKEKIIKEVSGTLEWCASEVNIVKGCLNQCLYCYASAMSNRFHRTTPAEWGTEVVNQKRLKKGYSKRKGRIMYPSTHDISPANLQHSIDTLRKILLKGNEVLIVSKPHFVVIERLCEEFKDYKQQILFRFSIGSTDSTVLAFWEPSAPNYDERRKCLEYAFKQGFQTSVSAEPYLDNHTEALVADLQHIVTDSIWIGKANMLKSRLKTNGHNSTIVLQKADELLEIQSDANVKLLYNKLCSNDKVKWKESIKKIVDIVRPTERGLDI